MSQFLLIASLKSKNNLYYFNECNKTILFIFNKKNKHKFIVISHKKIQCKFYKI